MDEAKHELLLVDWVDTSTNQNAVFYPDELKLEAPASLQLMGFGYEMEDKVVIASEYGHDDKGIPTYRHSFAIPKECIKKLKRLKEID